MPGVQFKYDLTITDNDLTTDESYVVDGMIRNSNAIHPNFLTTLTDNNGQMQFNVTVPGTVDSGDGMSMQIKTNSTHESIGVTISFEK